jgi:hypothetical protein
MHGHCIGYDFLRIYVCTYAVCVLPRMYVCTGCGTIRPHKYVYAVHIEEVDAVTVQSEYLFGPRSLCLNIIFALGLCRYDMRIIVCSDMLFTIVLWDHNP